MNARTNDNADRTLRIRGRYGNDIVALAQELQRVRESTLDVVAPTVSLRATATTERAADDPAGVGPTEVRLEVPDHGTYALTRHGHAQLAEKTGIPFGYYERMQVAGMNGLVAENVNAWLGRQQGSDRRLVRIADGKVRAVLGASYRVLDNYDLAMLVMDRAKEHGASIQSADLTETRLYMKIVVPGYRESIKRGDDVVGGLVVSNSEVGNGAFRVEPFLFRLVCQNGMIGESSLYQVHVGKRLEIGELVFSRETRQLTDAALWSEVRDVMDGTFDQTVLREIVKKLRGTTKVEIEAPKEVTDVVAKNLGLSDERKTDLIRYFAKEGDTLYGLVQGVTRLAQDFEDAEDQVRLERYAGQIVAGKVRVVA